MSISMPYQLFQPVIAYPFIFNQHQYILVHRFILLILLRNKILPISEEKIKIERSGKLFYFFSVE